MLKDNEVIADDKTIAEDMAQLQKIVDAMPFKSECYWDSKTDKVVKIKAGFNPQKMLGNLLGRKP